MLDLYIVYIPVYRECIVQYMNSSPHEEKNNPPFFFMDKKSHQYQVYTLSAWLDLSFFPNCSSDTVCVISLLH